MWCLYITKFALLAECADAVLAVRLASADVLRPNTAVRSFPHVRLRINSRISVCVKMATNKILNDKIKYWMIEMEIGDWNTCLVTQFLEEQSHEWRIFTEEFGQFFHALRIGQIWRFRFVVGRRASIQILWSICLRSANGTSNTSQYVDTLWVVWRCDKFTSNWLDHLVSVPTPGSPNAVISFRMINEPHSVPVLQRAILIFGIFYWCPARKWEVS